jgi:ubiquinone/menaquinone biosynthesis C-methylase UbiE
MTNLKPIIKHYLSHRPAFFAFIRPQEAALFREAKSKCLKSPILDFGCGDGFFASQIFKPGEVEIGLDVKNSRINESGRFYQNLITYNGDTIPLSGESTQTVVSNCVLEHLPHLSLNLKEVYRVLKPGGFFITTVMTDKWEPHLLGGKIFGKKYLDSFRHRQEHLNLYSQQQWDQAFITAGFHLVETIGYLHPQAVFYNELFHYLSLPALISYKLTGKWVPLKNWHQPLHLGDFINRIIKSDCGSPKNAAALFYILKH